MQKLYLDCDGVILDTINRSYQQIQEKNLTTEEEITRFYNNIDWEKLIEESGPIKDSINKIKKLTNHFDIEILTHVNTNYEARVKIEYFAKELPGINVIPVQKGIKKADYVTAKDAVLVDDFTKNLDYWYEKGGIPVKFSNSGKSCSYTVIADLLELINIFNEKEIKIKE